MLPMCACRQRMEVEAAGLLPAGSADWEELPSAQRKSLLSSLREQHNVVELVTGMAREWNLQSAIETKPNPYPKPFQERIPGSGMNVVPLCANLC